jgi:hypothetical protein
MSEDHQQ